MSEKPKYSLWTSPPETWGDNPLAKSDMTIEELEAKLAEYVEPPPPDEFRKQLDPFRTPVTPETLMCWSD